MSRNAVPLIVLGVFLLVAAGLYAFYVSSGDGGTIEEPPRGAGAAVDEDVEDVGRARRTGSSVTGTPGSREAGGADVANGEAARGPAVVAGRAVEAGSGKALGGVTVVIDDDGEGSRATTGGDGAFRVDVVAGSARGLVLELGAARSDRIALDDLAPGETRALGDVALRIGREVRGRVLAAGGAPVAGARVALMPHVDAMASGGFDIMAIMRRIWVEDEQLATTTTGTDGRFAFEGVETGTYAVRVDAEGKESAYSASLRVAPQAASPSVDITLADGRGLKGRVVDEAGAPIAGAVIACMSEPRSSRFSFLAQRTRSGEDGRFAFDSLGAGRLIVMAKAEGYAPAGDSDYDPEKGGEIELKLMKGARLSGRVYDKATGDGIGDVTLFLTSFQNPAFIETVSKADGTYAFETVPIDGVTLMVQRDGYQLAFDKEDDSFFPMGGRNIEKAALADGAEILDVPMTRGGVVRGRVTDADSGLPIAGARVRAFGMSNFSGGFGRKADEPARTDEQGRYELTGVSPDDVVVLAQHPDYLAPELDIGTFFMNGEESERPGVPLRAGQILEGQDVALKKGRRITGVVKTPDGKPVAGAKIVDMTDQDEGRGFFAMMMAMGGAAPEEFSGVDGRFALRGLDPTAELKIGAQHPDHPGGGVTAVPAGVAETEVEIVMNPMVTLSGKVFLPDGRPGADIELTFSPENRIVDTNVFTFGDDGIEVRTDAAGRYRIEALPVGEVTITYGNDWETLDASGGPRPRIPAESARVTLRPGADNVHDIRMVMPITITGMVYLPDGVTPAPNGSLSLTDADGNSDWTWIADGRNPGRFVFTDVEPDSVSTITVNSWEGGDEDNAPTHMYTATIPNVRAGTKDLVIVLEKTN